MNLRKNKIPKKAKKQRKYVNVLDLANCLCLTCRHLEIIEAKCTDTEYGDGDLNCKANHSADDISCVVYCKRFTATIPIKQLRTVTKERKLNEQ